MMWAEVLNLKRVSALDNFLDCGGDSLSAMPVGMRVAAECLVELEPPEVLFAATLRELAQIVDANGGRPPSLSNR